MSSITVMFRLELLCFKYSEEHEGIAVARETMQCPLLKLCVNKPHRQGCNQFAVG